MEGPSRRAAMTRDTGAHILKERVNRAQWERSIFTGRRLADGYHKRSTGWSTEGAGTCWPEPAMASWLVVHTHSHSSPSLPCVVSLAFSTLPPSKCPFVPIVSGVTSTAGLEPLSFSSSYTGTQPLGSGIKRRDFEEAIGL